MVLSEPARVGSTRRMVRYTVTDVASFTLAQPVVAAAGDPSADDVAAAAEADDVAAPDDAAPDDAAGAPAAVEAVTEAHPARAEHSSTASTVPRTGGGDIMLL
jgi:hypothetical protein